jgi:hypothetical protein
LEEEIKSVSAVVYSFGHRYMSGKAVAGSESVILEEKGS